MEPKAKHKSNLLHSFRYAFEGMHSAFKTETNWKIGIIEALVTIFAGFFFQISHTDWITVVILMGVVLYAELCNSAIEAIVDSFTDTEHPGAKLAKDFSAGSVVILIITSAIVGIIIFTPYIKAWLG